MTAFSKRSSNIIKAGFSFAASSFTGKVTGNWMPVNISVELTNLCNLKCPECYTGSGKMTRPAGFMEKKLFEKIFKELVDYVVNANLYFQGEPLLHPELFDFLGLTRGISTVISTNGHFITEEAAEKLAHSGLKKIIISLDGMNQETYSRYRADGDLQTVFKSIRNLSVAVKNSGTRMKTEIQFLVNKYNEGQIAEAERFVSGTGADFRLKSMQIINTERISEWLPGKRKFSRYELIKGRYEIKNSLPGRCLRLWIHPVITWDGNVIPCCFDKNAEYVMGNLNYSSFREIWQGNKFREFRSSVLRNRELIDICRNCTSGLREAVY